MSPRIGKHSAHLTKRLLKISGQVVLGYTLTSCGTSDRSSKPPQSGQSSAVIPPPESRESFATPVRTDELKIDRVSSQEEPSNTKKLGSESTGGKDTGRTIDREKDKLSLSLIPWDSESLIRSATHAEIRLTPVSIQFIPGQPLECDPSTKGPAVLDHIDDPLFWGEDIFDDGGKTVFGKFSEEKTLDVSWATNHLLPFKYGQKINIYGAPKGTYKVKVRLLNHDMVPLFEGDDFAIVFVDQTASNKIDLCPKI